MILLMWDLLLSWSGRGRVSLYWMVLMLSNKEAETGDSEDEV